MLNSFTYNICTRRIAPELKKVLNLGTECKIALNVRMLKLSEIDIKQSFLTRKAMFVKTDYECWLGKTLFYRLIER